jgi:tetratricopeptide (TPR) repeat protein
MTSSLSRLTSCAVVALALALPAFAQEGARRYPGQLTRDWQAGRVPTADEVAAAERDAAERPSDLDTVRRLAKGYFFQYFGGKKAEALPKSRDAFARALAIAPEDSESIVYSASLDALEAMRSPEGPARDTKFRSALAGLEHAQKVGPRDGAVLSVSCATYLFFPDSYNTAPRSAAIAESIRKEMGPYFSRFAPHGQQRILLTQGQAYVRMGRVEDARACFEEGLKVSTETVEHGLLEVELEKLQKPAGK